MPPNVNELKDAIKTKVSESILGFATRAVGRQASYQPLDLIIPVERKIRSIVGGLETSLGTTLWEPLAKELARLNGFTVKGEKLQVPKLMPHLLSSTLDTVIDQRILETEMFTAQTSMLRIKETCQQFLQNPIPEFVNAPSGNGVDIWLMKDGINYFFDTKTVQPNIGDFSKFLRQLMTWYAYFYSRFPDQNAEARIVFPYNPYEGDFFAATKKNARPLIAHEEAWVENEFWDFCSGVEGTFQLIETCLQEIQASGQLSAALNNLFRP